MRVLSEETESACRFIARLCECLRTVDQKLAEAPASKDVRTYSSADIAEPKDSSSLTMYEEAPVDGHDSGLKILPHSDLVAAGFPSEGRSVPDFPFHVGRRPESKEPALPVIPYSFLKKHNKGSSYGTLDARRGHTLMESSPCNACTRDCRQLERDANSVIAGGPGSSFAVRVMIDSNISYLLWSYLLWHSTPQQTARGTRKISMMRVTPNDISRNTF